MKRCPRCEETKPETEFHKAVKRADGLYAYCKPCSRERVHEWESSHSEARRAACRRREQRHPGRKRRGTPEQESARRAVKIELKHGRLARPTECPSCGRSDSKVHAHHDDYAKPLDIEWLCARCHGRLHKQAA
jgi:ribosomal protein S27AE